MLDSFAFFSEGNTKNITSPLTVTFGAIYVIVQNTLRTVGLLPRNTGTNLPGDLWVYGFRPTDFRGIFSSSSVQLLMSIFSRGHSGLMLSSLLLFLLFLTLPTFEGLAPKVTR